MLYYSHLNQLMVALRFLAGTCLVHSQVAFLWCETHGVEKPGLYKCGPYPLVAAVRIYCNAYREVNNNHMMMMMQLYIILIALYICNCIVSVHIYVICNI